MVSSVKAYIVYPNVYLLSAAFTPQVEVAFANYILVFPEDLRLVPILLGYVFVALDARWADDISFHGANIIYSSEITKNITIQLKLNRYKKQRAHKSSSVRPPIGSTQ